ncbi:hypothetical protein ONZ51_g11256 [Trametes cubensis]|uniref:Uncharacterized protein n=1 Tax=Trametes cubensis TaxID=1111947 RepID=A0AAD7THX3_9APHY|nr:hypothetical protein ONZ51_g11256 [Trametes cubensis]
MGSYTRDTTSSSVIFTSAPTQPFASPSISPPPDSAGTLISTQGTSSSGTGIPPGTPNPYTSTISNLPKPVLPPSHSHSNTLTILLPVISVILLAAAAICLRRRLRRRISLWGWLAHRAFEPPTSRDQQESPQGEHDAHLVEEARSVSSRGSLDSSWHVDGDVAVRKALYGDVAMPSDGVLLETNCGRGTLAILDPSSEPLRSSMGALDDRSSTCQCRTAGARAHFDMAIDDGVSTGGSTSNLSRQAKDCMAIPPELPPIDAGSERDRSPVEPQSASEAIVSTPTSSISGGQTGHAEPRALTLVLPWALGQHLLSLAAANPLPHDEALHPVDGEATEPPPPYHLI